MIAIEIDKKSDKPLYAQIRDRIRRAIEDKELSPGDKLPPVAAFAKQVGVTQATIRRALEDLKTQGLAYGHVGRGTFVGNPSDTAESPGLSRGGGPVSGRGGDARPVRAARQLRQGVSKGLCDLMTLASQPGVLDFAKGIPNPDLVAPGLLAEMTAKAMAAGEKAYMEYGDLKGSEALRQAIARRYADAGVKISPDQVLITNGAQQGACIAALDTAEKHRRVILKTPGFQGVVDAFVAAGNWVDTVIADHGSDVAEQLAAFNGSAPKLLGICPDFHNPIGEEMMAAQRQRIGAWAKQNDCIILSDEIYQDLRFDGRPLAPMINLMGEEQTIIISSLSKSLMSGLRIGWMISSPRRIAEFAKIKRLMGQTGPALMQGIALGFLTSGAYDRHLADIRKIYARRRDVMLSCLDQLMPEGVSWTKPNGGFALWVTLPRGYSSVALLISVLDKGINIVPGPVFDVDQRFINAFRMGWAWTGEEEIVEGMEVLADAVKELLRKPPGDSGLSGLGHF